MEEAHKTAFQQTLEFIEEKIMVNLAVLPLSDICSYYRAKLDETEYPNPNYRAEKLKVH